MRSSMVLASLLFLLLILATRSVHGVRKLETHRHAALNNKEDARDSKWQHPSSAPGRPMDTRRASDGRGGVSGGTTPEHPTTATGRGRAEEEGAVEEVEKMMGVVAPRVHEEDYVGPSGHSPNHHRTNPCGTCT